MPSSRRTALSISRCKSEKVFDLQPVISSSGDSIDNKQNNKDSFRKVVSMEEKLVAAYKAAKAKDNEYPSEDEFVELKKLKLLREQKIHEQVKDETIIHDSRGGKEQEGSVSEALTGETKIPTSKSTNTPLFTFKMPNDASVQIQPLVSLNNLEPNLKVSDQKNPDGSHKAVTITDESVRNKHLRRGLKNMKFNNVIISDSDDEVVGCSQKPIEQRYLKVNNDWNTTYPERTKTQIAGRPQAEEKKKASPAGENIRPHSVKSGCNSKSKLAVKKRNTKDAAVQTMVLKWKDWQVCEAQIVWPDAKMYPRKRLDYSYVRKLWWRRK